MPLCKADPYTNRKTKSLVNTFFCIKFFRPCDGPAVTPNLPNLKYLQSVVPKAVI